MSDYLLQIAIGPIQDFISAARRTRDLWAGSTMLSDIAKAVAQSVNDQGGKLIFPNATSEQLQKEDFSVANVILAEVNGAEPEKMREIADAARKEARDCFRAYADNAFRKMERFIDKDRWEAQIKDVIEFYSAWVPVNGDYKNARKRVARLLAARKNIRDFEPNPCPATVHKCALDGLRESVFKKGDGRPSEEDVRQFPDDVRVKVNEALDAVGLIKRVPTRKDERFPSVSRVAIDPWIRGRGKDFIERNGRVLSQYCDDLVEHGVLSRVMDKAYQAFPYEGVVLMPSRHAAMMAEFGKENSPRKEAVEKLCGEIAEVVKGLPSKEQPPEPYLAFLVADGDRMGATLSDMGSADEHRKFSSELAKFAGDARKIIEECNGVCVYTGGDDVMAFLPLDTALGCARALHDEFHKLMGDFGNTPPTLSVGVSIAHAMEDLELQLEYGRKAESAAKKDVDGKAVERGNDRNGLAVSVRSRGNIAVTVREQWDNADSEGLKGTPLDQRLEWWAERFLNNEIPNKFPYELRENAAFYDGWPDEKDEDKATLQNAVQHDIQRIFGRKDVKLEDDKSKVQEYIMEKVKDAKSIRALADELILAQWIAFGMDQAQKGDKVTNEIQNHSH